MVNAIRIFVLKFRHEITRKCSSNRLCLTFPCCPPWHRWGSRCGGDLTSLCGPVAWHRTRDEDHYSSAWRRWWRGASRPPQQSWQDEEVAVAQAESLRGHPHGHRARRVADKLPVIGHGGVWGELEQKYKISMTINKGFNLTSFKSLTSYPFSCFLQKKVQELMNIFLKPGQEKTNRINVGGFIINISDVSHLEQNIWDYLTVETNVTPMSPNPRADVDIISLLINLSFFRLTVLRAQHTF